MGKLTKSEITRGGGGGGGGGGGAPWVERGVWASAKDAGTKKIRYFGETFSPAREPDC